MALFDRYVGIDYSVTGLDRRVTGEDSTRITDV